jgi:hypothetical protein
LEGFFGKATYAKENGHEIWDVECKKSVLGNSFMTVVKEMSEYKLDLVGVQRSDGQRFHRTSRRVYIFLWKAE